MAGYFEHYNLTASSGLFDEAYYLENNPDVNAVEVDPLAHYIELGAKELRNPGPNFDAAFYVSQCPTILEDQANPLVHYLTIGAACGLKPLQYKPLWVTEPSHYLPEPLLQVAGNGIDANVALTEEAGHLIQLWVDRPALAKDDVVLLCSGDLEIIGWCTADAGIAKLVLLIDETFVADVSVGITREDVRAAFPERDDALRSGFEVSIPRRHLPRGEHVVTVRVFDNTGAQNSVLFSVSVPDEAEEDAFCCRIYYTEVAFRLRKFAEQAARGREGAATTDAHNDVSDDINHLRTCVSVLKATSEAFLEVAASQGDVAFKQLGNIMRCLGSLPGGVLGEQIADPPFLDNSGLGSFLERYRPLSFDDISEPKVSIVIPVHNNFFFTYQCLSALWQYGSKAGAEIIIVDDGSIDETIILTRVVHGVKIIRNKVNCGFLESCNNGARAATAKYIMFLNNDAQITAGAIDALVDTFTDTNVGLVGSKLIYPDGTLQEAGGLIWRNATGWNYGRGEDPDHPYYNYRRSVDYCSGASLMIPRALWEELGGFDVRYRPAYFEDVDLAFRVREVGYDVLYQPASVVIHWEGISSGREPDQGIKAFQIVNERIFRDRWAAVLQTHAPRGEQPLLERDRGCEKRALFVDATTPTPDQDAGSNVAVAHMRILQSLGYKVTFIPAHSFAFSSAYTPALQWVGIEAIYRPAYHRLDDFLVERGGEFALAYVHRFEIGEQAIPLLRRHAPGATIIFNTADLHYLRLERGARLSGSAAELDQARRVKERELAVIGAADCTLVCNSHEMELLGREIPSASLHYLPWVIEVERRALPDFADRAGFLFLGGFGHPPNVDAVRFFVADVMPHVRRLLPGVCFHVYGSKMPDELRELAGPDVIIEGFAPDLRAVFDHHRVCVAPLRYGAGFKGKVATSLAHGVPVVASPIAAEGTGLRDNEQLLVAGDPFGIASALQRLYTNRALWERLADGGLRYLNDHFSFEKGLEHLAKVLMPH